MYTQDSIIDDTVGKTLLYLLLSFQEKTCKSTGFENTDDILAAAYLGFLNQ